MDNYLTYAGHSLHEVVEKYHGMKDYAGSLYSEAMSQYRNMATGGDGGALHYWPSDWAARAVATGQEIKEPSCRSYNYPNCPDAFFQNVLELLDEV
mgnify:CR=1 FL=1